MKKLTLALLITFALGISITAYSNTDYNSAIYPSYPTGDFWINPIEYKTPSIALFSRMSVPLSEDIETYIYNKLYNGDDMIDLTSYNIGVDEGFDIYNNIVIENPELLTCTRYRYSDDGTYLRYLAPIYLVDATERQQARQLLKAGIARYAEYAQDYATDLDKIIAVHDKIIKDFEYDSSCSDISTNAYSFFMLDGDGNENGLATCQGYSQLFNSVMEEIGIECTFCYYSSSGEEAGHVWNMVKIDGSWYHIDLTWDDPVLNNGNLNTRMAYHTYFLVTDDTMQQDHNLKDVWIYTDSKYTANDTYYEDGTIFSTFGDYPGYIEPTSNGLYEFTWYGSSIGKKPISTIKIHDVIFTDIYEYSSHYYIGVYNYNKLADYTAILAYYNNNGTLIATETPSFSNYIADNKFSIKRIELNQSYSATANRVVLYVWNSPNQIVPCSVAAEYEF